MPNKRVTMRKLREILRLRLQAGLSVRAISRSTKLSVGGVQKLLSRAETLSLTWPLPAELDDARLAELFYPGADTHANPRREAPDWAAVHEELKRPHMTRQLVWEEYTQRYPNRCVSYSQFCDRYRHWLGRQQRTMRQSHKAGEKCFVDYAGSTVPIVDGATGEIRPAQLFVAVLGASDYTFAEATWTQTLPDWLGSHTRAMTFFGGVPALIIPDNLRSGVSRACRYDPDINPSYQQWAEHYRTAILPARPHKPRDKAKAEHGVLLVQRWILARLRHHRFFVLDEVNRHIAALLEDLNQRPFKRRPGCRRSAFEALDQPTLQPLPPHPYEYVHIQPVTVHIDYHVHYQRHPCAPGRPRLHHQPGPHARAPPGTAAVVTLTRWAKQLGPDVHDWVSRQLTRRPHPEQAYRTCLGLLQLSKTLPRQPPQRRLPHRQPGWPGAPQTGQTSAGVEPGLTHRHPRAGYRRTHPAAPGPRECPRAATLQLTGATP